MGITARLRCHDEARGKGLGFRRLGLGGALCFIGLAAGAPAWAQTANPFAAAAGAFTTAPGAYAPPPAATAAPAPPATAPIEIPAVPPAWLLTPAVTLGETFTDNVNLAPAGAHVWDFITTVTPELNLAGQTARLNLGLTYDPQELIFARSSPTAILQQRLLGTGTAILWPETLFFDASASIGQVFIRPTGPVGPSTLTTSNNLQTAYVTNASPYLRQHLGSFSDSETRYRFSTVSTSGSGIAPEQTHELRQTLISGETFGRIGWQLAGDYTRLNRLHDRTDPLGGTSGKDAYGRADFKYPVYQALSAIGGVGYERISDPSLATQPKGVIWNAGAQYQPNQLVSTTLTYGERFNTSDIEFNAAYYLDPQLRLGAVYTETIQTGQSQIAGNLNQQVAVINGVPTIIGPNGQPVTGAPTASGTSAFGVTSGAFLTKTAQLNATLTKERNTYSLLASYTKETGSSTLTSGGVALANVTAARVAGGTATWAHQLWPDLTATAAGSYYRSVFLDGSGRRDNTYALSLALAYSLSRTASATISLSRSDLRSNIEVDSLIVDTVMATIRKQF